MRTLFILLAALAITLGEECNPQNCKLPDCSCLTTKSPIGGDPSLTPQIVVISFDDAVNQQNFELYDFISLYTNPNNCPITMTFFVSHEYSEYPLVYELYRRGHEIAVHSVTHKPDVAGYWVPADNLTWKAEMTDSKAMLVKYGLIPEEKIVGFRAPFLVVGGDEMFEPLVENGFKYDCSWPTLKYTNWFSPSDGVEPLGGAFPFTMDYETDLDDPTYGRRPDNTYPGFWSVPMLDLEDDRGVPCAMLDACQGEGFNCSTQECQDTVYNFMKNNFDRSYYGSRVPFGLYSHESWFHTGADETHQIAYMRFLGYLASLPDVWMVSLNQLVQWMAQPTSSEDINNFGPFSCSDPEPSRCQDSEWCEYTFNEQQRRMHICGTKCPENYPWLGNPDGN